MNPGTVIAVDAMGGDGGPAAVVPGALAAAHTLQIGLVLAGDGDAIRNELARHPVASSLDIRVAETPDVIDMAEPASAAVREKRRASIRVAAEAVRDGLASAMVSAGHTGATVMTAIATFGRLRGIERPALATVIPTLQAPAVLLDSGATVDCRPGYLVQFALLGVAFARVALGRSSPRVALLSVGHEETKGNELTREAYRLLKSAPIDFIGNIEGGGLFSGTADVIVCDGFTGNITLKMGEGLAETFEHLLHEELTASFGTRVGYLLSRQAFRRFRKRVDPAEFGGAPLVGTNGLCIVAHGRSSPRAVSSAVSMAVRFANDQLIDKMGSDLDFLSQTA